MNTDVHAMSGAYAIDALSPEEANRFERHLETCEVCQHEVRELQEAAARLGAAEAAQPPAALKAQVMSAAAEQRQLPPAVRREETDRPDRRRTWLPRLSVAAAAAVLTGVGAIGYQQLLSPQEDDRLASGVVRVFEAPDATQATMRTENGGTISVAASPSLDRIALDTDRLPDLDDAEVYQLWTIEDGAATPAGLLDPDRGAAMELPEEGTTVALTVEPAGGSEQPTSDPIMTVTAGDL